MLATVDALLPLSLLEAVRDVDTPSDLDAEFVDELRNKRFGLSDTVYTQIRRYTESVRKRHRTAQEESVALASSSVVAPTPRRSFARRAAIWRVKRMSPFPRSPVVRCAFSLR